MKLPYDDILELLGYVHGERPVLEILGYEYSDAGMERYLQERPNIVPVVTAAIGNDLRIAGVFPRQFAGTHPPIGQYLFVEDGCYILRDIDKPSVWVEERYGTARDGALALIRKRMDSSWLPPDVREGVPLSVRTSWG